MAYKFVINSSKKGSPFVAEFSTIEDGNEWFNKNNEKGAFGEDAVKDEPIDMTSELDAIAAIKNKKEIARSALRSLPLTKVSELKDAFEMMMDYLEIE